MRIIAAAMLTLAWMIGLPVQVTASPSDIARLAIIGDSITEGYGAPAGQGYADRLESYQPGDNILPLGRSGATVRRWLPGGPWYPDLDRLAGWQPSAVVVNLGTNDYYVARRTSDYQSQLGQLVAEIRGRTPGTRVILWHQFGGFIAPNPQVCDMEPCVDQTPPAPWHDFGVAMRAAAVANGTGYVDDSTAKPWGLWLHDGVHPDAHGHYQLFLSIRDRLLACC